VIVSLLSSFVVVSEDRIKPSGTRVERTFEGAWILHKM